MQPPRNGRPVGAAPARPDEPTEPVVAPVEQRAGERRAHGPLELVAGRAGREDEVRLVEIAAEPRRPTREVAADAPAGELVEELLDQISLGEALDQPELPDPDRRLARDRPGEIDRCVSRATRSPTSSSLATSGTASLVARPPRASSGPSSARPSVRPGARSPTDPTPQLELLGATFEQVHVTGARTEKLARATAAAGRSCLEGGRLCDLLGERGQALQLSDPRRVSS